MRLAVLSHKSGSKMRSLRQWQQIKEDRKNNSVPIGFIFHFHKGQQSTSILRLFSEHLLYTERSKVSRTFTCPKNIAEYQLPWARNLLDFGETWKNIPNCFPHFWERNRPTEQSKIHMMYCRSCNDTGRSKYYENILNWWPYNSWSKSEYYEWISIITLAQQA